MYKSNMVDVKDPSDFKRGSPIKTHTHSHHGCNHSHGNNGDDDHEHWKRFMEHTSCHGVFQIQNTRSKTGKWIWTAIVLGAFAGLVTMVCVDESWIR